MAQRGGGQQQQPAALARPIIVPTTYKGRREEDWRAWLSSFNAACVVNGYGDADRTRFMGALVEGTAQQIFNNVHTANQNATYQQLCDLLTAQFEPQQQQQLHEVELRARTKKPQETQTMFAAALQLLATRAFPGQQGGIVQRIVLQQFIDGQASPEIRLQLAANRPATLDAAIERAITVSTAYQMEAMRTAPQHPPAAVAAAVEPSKGDQTTVVMTELLTLIRKMDRKLDEVAQMSSNARSRPRQVFSGACYNCGERGHYARSCSNPRPHQGNGR